MKNQIQNPPIRYCLKPDLATFDVFPNRGFLVEKDVLHVVSDDANGITLFCVFFVKESTTLQPDIKKVEIGIVGPVQFDWTADVVQNGRVIEGDDRANFLNGWDDLLDGASIQHGESF